ncbi:MAG: right-handed parallel beta-helix repeat-containing protein, partial [Desulfobacterales bacterium]|nr:right-handed parallel beta-helix repeat-containing protein [Desulfobacterales bacterium]
SPTTPGARASNLQPPHTIDVGAPCSLQKTAAISLPQQYVEHEPIHITKNADFAAFGFPGEGSPSNPYVIEGLNITAYKTLIRIQETMTYFCIRNNLLNGLTGEPYGIYLGHVTHGTIDSNIITNCTNGIYLGGSGQNTVSNNILSHHGWRSPHWMISAGIYLEGSRLNTLSGNTISNCRSGICLARSAQNTVSHNIITGSGIFLDHSAQNTLAHNTVSTPYLSNPATAICLQHSAQNTLVGNRLVNGGLYIEGGYHPPQIENYYQATVADNLVNGRPLVFWQQVRGGTVPPGAGQIFLINCTGVEVTGQDLARVYDGVVAVASSNLNIHHNIVSNNAVGIALWGSTQTTVAHNTVSYNHYWGIDLAASEGSTLFNNTVSHCGLGIALGYGGHNNTVSNNTISYNHNWGIDLAGSEDNMVTGNDFLGNRPGGRSQACDNGRGNVFARNYWIDHDNTDQNGDGIADASYFIEGLNKDSTPLAFPANLNRHLLLIPIIQYPKGGETLQGMEMIEWAGALDSLGHPVTYTVTYSPDNGSTWIPLSSRLSTTSYEWDTTTVADGFAYRVQVVATCADGLSTEDRSDAPFNIRNIAHSLSTPTFTYPNGGEMLQGTVTLHWTPTSDTWEHSVTYAVSYSADDGQTWILLASGLSTSECE